MAFLSVSALMGVVGAGMLVPVAGPTALAAKSVPSVFNELPGDLQTVAPAEESQLLDSSGGVIAHFYDKQRIVVPSSHIADVMKKAIVAIEDKRFYEHNGVDATGIARAFVTNLGDTGHQGASTITQQYVRNSLAERGYLEGDADQVSAATEQTTERKLREVKYALALEKTLSKDEILTGYLNIASFGPITYGVEAASQRYFSKSASELDYLESALLAGLVQSPVQYDPLVHPDTAQNRRDTVLATMLKQGVITQEEFDRGVETTVEAMLNPTVSSEGCSGAESSKAYFCDFVLAQFLDDPTFGATRIERERVLKTQGITIRTTMDSAKQAAAYTSLTNTIPVGDPSGLNDALVSLDPRSELLGGRQLPGRVDLQGVHPAAVVQGGTLRVRDRGFLEHLLPQRVFQVRRASHRDRGLPGERPRRQDGNDERRSRDRAVRQPGFRQHGVARGLLFDLRHRLRDGHHRGWRGSLTLPGEHPGFRVRLSHADGVRFRGDCQLRPAVHTPVNRIRDRP